LTRWKACPKNKKMNMKKKVEPKKEEIKHEHKGGWV
jgi:hypothetical protein